MQSPFIQQQPELVPRVLKPLVYCQFRVASAPGQYEVDVQECATFACDEVHEMFFCVSHAKVILAALAVEEGASS